MDSWDSTVELKETENDFLPAMFFRAGSADRRTIWIVTVHKASSKWIYLYETLVIFCVCPK